MDNSDSSLRVDVSGAVVYSLALAACYGERLSAKRNANGLLSLSTAS